MARVASLIRRAARGVRESKRFGLVFYELNGSPLFALESREKALTLYVAERAVLRDFSNPLGEADQEHGLVNFRDLNRLPLPDIEKLIRASVVSRRERERPPKEAELLSMWGVHEEKAAVAPPIVRISMRTQEEAEAEEAAKAEALRKAEEVRRILKPDRPEKTLARQRAEQRAAKALESKSAKATSGKAARPASGTASAVGGKAKVSGGAKKPVSSGKTTGKARAETKAPAAGKRS